MSFTPDELNIENLRNCPITDIKFVSVSSEAEENYEYAECSADIKIGFSKITPSRRPLTQFRVSEDPPCMDDYMPSSFKTNYKT